VPKTGKTKHLPIAIIAEFVKPGCKHSGFFDYLVQQVFRDLPQRHSESIPLFHRCKSKEES
jgi:hypothetical protein